MKKIFVKTDAKRNVLISKMMSKGWILLEIGDTIEGKYAVFDKDWNIQYNSVSTINDKLNIIAEFLGIKE